MAKKYIKVTRKAFDADPRSQVMLDVFEQATQDEYGLSLFNGKSALIPGTQTAILRTIDMGLKQDLSCEQVMEEIDDVVWDITGEVLFEEINGILAEPHIRDEILEKMNEIKNQEPEPEEIRPNLFDLEEFEEKAQDRSEKDIHIDSIMDIAKTYMMQEDLSEEQQEEVKEMVFDDLMESTDKIADIYKTPIEKVLKLVLGNENYIQKMVQKHIGHVK